MDGDGLRPAPTGTSREGLGGATRARDLSGSKVIVSGKGGVRHPVVYGADSGRRFVRVPVIDSPVAFLLTVSG